MATDREIYSLVLKGQLGSAGVTDVAALVTSSQSRQYQSVAKAADGMASTTTAETDLNICFNRLSRIKSVKYMPTGGALTADNTNNAAITVSKRDAAGANLTTVASETTNVASGNWVQRTLKSLTLTAANVDVVAGGSCTFSIAKGGSGVVVPAGFFVIDVEEV